MHFLMTRVYAPDPDKGFEKLGNKSCTFSFIIPDESSLATQQQDSFPLLSRKSEKSHKKKRIRRKHALKEICKYQRSVQLLIPRLPFQRLVKEIAHKNNPTIKFTTTALNALQEASEAYITGLMEDGVLCCIHANRVTVMKKDLILANRIRGDRE